MNTKSLLAGLALATILTGAAHAGSVTLDNSPSNGNSAGACGALGGNNSCGVVFTAPITGNLTSFTLWLNGGIGSLEGAVGTWNGGPTFGFGFGSPSTLYQSAPTASPGAGPYTFAPNVGVTAGQRYVAFLSVWGDAAANNNTTMRLSSNLVPGIDYFVYNGTPDPYGNSHWNYSTDFNGSGTAQFAASFLSPTPEPAAWTLMLVGFGGVGFLARRKAWAVLSPA